MLPVLVYVVPHHQIFAATHPLVPSYASLSTSSTARRNQTIPYLRSCRSMHVTSFRPFYPSRTRVPSSRLPCIRTYSHKRKTSSSGMKSSWISLRTSAMTTSHCSLHPLAWCHMSRLARAAPCTIFTPPCICTLVPYSLHFSSSPTLLPPTLAYSTQPVPWCRRSSVASRTRTMFHGRMESFPHNASLWCSWSFFEAQ